MANTPTMMATTATAPVAIAARNKRRAFLAWASTFSRSASRSRWR